MTAGITPTRDAAARAELDALARDDGFVADVAGDFLDLEINSTWRNRQNLDRNSLARDVRVRHNLERYNLERKLRRNGGAP